MYTIISMRIRKARAFKLDEALIEGLSELARQQNISANRLLENMLFEKLKQAGILSDDIKPLGETRGGDQKSAKTKNDV